jgi:hypothetical protein
MEEVVKRAIATELIKMIHRCVLNECPRFDFCLNDLSICIFRQPREVNRDPWELWQYVLRAREKCGEGPFLEIEEPYNEEQLREILAECQEDLAAEIDFTSDNVKFTIHGL